MRAINTTPKPPKPPKGEPSQTSLLRALAHYGIDGIGFGEKTYWRDLIMRGGPWTAEEQTGIQDYNESDPTAIDRLLPVMWSRGDIDLPCALNRGRYMAAVARMEALGVPMDMERFNWLREHSEEIVDLLFTNLGPSYGVHTKDRTFNENLFRRYLADRQWTWPLLESGRLDLKDKTFKAMAEIHPELEPLRQLRYAQDKLKLGELLVGKDGFNRCWLNPFGSRTSRNQPSNTEFIFGPAIWLREFLIQPKKGYGLAYIDWEGQEFGIAAALSGDLAMQKAYNSGNMYFAFGKQAGIIPQDAVEENYKAERDRCKICVLGTQFGIGYRTLAERIGQPEITARELLRAHRKVYSTYWKWSDNRVYRTAASRRQDTVFGWTHRFLEVPKPNSARNFFMQANGAEMLRLACCYGTENGIQICAPVHDAVLITAPLEQLETDIARMQEYMEEASRVVLNGCKRLTNPTYHFVADFAEVGG
jgi:hypothetical protein